MVATGHSEHAELSSAYDYLCRTTSDINEHLPTLAALGSGKTVTEIGFRSGVSAVALLHGGCDHLTSYDVEDCPLAQHVAILGGDRFHFIKRNSRLGPPQGRPRDVLFIDGDHSYAGVMSDLLLWSPSTMERIAMHDTDQPKLPGVAKALADWLKTAKEWYVERHFSNNNGLTILARQ